MPKKDRKARRDANRLERQVESLTAQLNSLKDVAVLLERERTARRDAEALLQTANQANHRLSQDVFRLHIRHLRDDRRFCLNIEVDRRGLYELRYQGRDYWLSMLCERFYVQLERLSHEESMHLSDAAL
jgi:hypothetical protein